VDHNGSSSSVAVVESSSSVGNSSSIPVINEDELPLPLEFDGSNKPVMAVPSEGSSEITTISREDREQTNNAIKEQIRKRAKKSHLSKIETELV
jgi:hypothetical protein